MSQVTAPIHAEVAVRHYATGHTDGRVRIERLIRRWSLNAMVVGIVIWSMFPIYWMITSSIRPPSTFISVNQSLIPTAVTFDYYSVLLSSRGFVLAYINSFVVSIISTVLGVAAATGMGYVLARYRFAGSFAFLRLMLIAYMLPPLLIGIPLVRVLATVGLDDTLLGLIIAQVSIALPFGVWMLWSFFQTIPFEIEESALIDGATRLQSLWLIVLPLAWPGIMSVALFSMVVSWTDFTYALLIINSPDNRTVPLALAAMIGDYDMRWGEILAGGTLVTLPILVLFSLASRYFVQGLTAGAVKG
jgi:multiple sugar transport system permease protein